MAFDPLSATITDVHDALKSRTHSILDIINIYLSRIASLNPIIHAVISTNPLALAEARDCDQQLSDHENVHSLLQTKPLFGIPTLLKDNFDCPPMPTTAGCMALRDCIPTEDARTVATLKSAGAIILGKTNMQELALEGLTVSSLGGQTLNPWDLTRTPGGSSGGSGAALAAGLCVIATGSDTVNSLRSPASANGMVSCRPTRGLISRHGIVPLSYTQDAVGPMGKCVEDVALALNVMASVGIDPDDDVTNRRPTTVATQDFTALLGVGDLRGVRVGLLESFFDSSGSSETHCVSEVFESLRRRLHEAGGAIVPVREAIYDSQKLIKELDVQRLECREQLTRYLSKSKSTKNYPKSMSELYESGEFLVIPAQYEIVKQALNESTASPEYHKRLDGIEKLKASLADTFDGHKLDALIYPEQANLVVKVGSPSQRGRNGILGALTGSPVVAIPAGRSKESLEAPEGVPVGLEILGKPWSEPRLLQIASNIEKLGLKQSCPKIAEEPIEEFRYSTMPVILPKRDVPANYSGGTLGPAK